MTFPRTNQGTQTHLGLVPDRHTPREFQTFVVRCPELTRAQARWVFALLSGHTNHTTLARACGVETITSARHAQYIYRRVGVDSRGGLDALVRHFWSRYADLRWRGQSFGAASARELDRTSF
jgi:hypothetical protein